MIDAVKRNLSKVNQLPVVNLISPGGHKIPSDADLDGYLRAQKLAKESALEVSKLLEPGWTEIQAARMVDTYLQDCGVTSFFHRAFAWYGDRTRFEGVKNYRGYLPTKRVLRENEVYILDVAPIYEGYICDIGYTSCYGDHQDYARAQDFLAMLKDQIPAYFDGSLTGSEIWRRIDEEIRDAGYDNIHALYPFSVLGHRVHKAVSQSKLFEVLNFGWQSYWAFISRGVFGQLLNPDFDGELTGLWAIEPHIGTGDFGAKFEEILLVTDEGARWIESPMELPQS